MKQAATQIKKAGLAYGLPLKISSSAFNNGGSIPERYTCDGINVNPPLEIEGIPAGTKSLAIIVDDPDAPSHTWVHWVAWNLPVTRHINEKSITLEQGMNDFEENTYKGPCPPVGTHRYFFKIYALDTLLHLPAKTTKTGLQQAMQQHITGFGELMGRYKRK